MWQTLRPVPYNCTSQAAPEQSLPFLLNIAKPAIHPRNTMTIVQRLQERRENCGIIGYEGNILIEIERMWKKRQTDYKSHRIGEDGAGHSWYGTLTLSQDTWVLTLEVTAVVIHVPRISTRLSLSTWCDGSRRGSCGLHASQKIYNQIKGDGGGMRYFVQWYSHW